MDWLFTEQRMHKRMERNRAIWWRVKLVGYPIAVAAVVYLWYMSKVLA